MQYKYSYEPNSFQSVAEEVVCTPLSHCPASMSRPRAVSSSMILRRNARLTPRSSIGRRASSSGATCAILSSAQWFDIEARVANSPFEMGDRDGPTEKVCPVIIAKLYCDLNLGPSGLAVTRLYTNTQPRMASDIPARARACVLVRSEVGKRVRAGERRCTSSCARWAAKATRYPSPPHTRTEEY